MTLKFINVPQAIYVHIDDRALSRSSSERRFFGRDIRRIADRSLAYRTDQETVLERRARMTPPRHYAKVCCEKPNKLLTTTERGEKYNDRCFCLSPCPRL